MSSPWSAPDAGRPASGPGAPPPPPPPPPPGPPPSPGGSSTPGGYADRAGRAGRAGRDPGPQPPGGYDDPFVPQQDGEVAPPPGATGPVYGYGAPGGSYGPPPVWPTLPGNDPLAVASLVCGIVAIVGALILPLPLGPVALGLGIAALVRINRRGLRGRGMAIAGVVLGGLSTLGLLLAVVFLGLAFTGLLVGGI